MVIISAASLHVFTLLTLTAFTIVIVAAESASSLTSAVVASPTPFVSSIVANEILASASAVLVAILIILFSHLPRES